MATEQQAKSAAKKNATRLRKLGAHSIGTADGRSFGVTGYVVVANVVPGSSTNLPSHLSSSGGQTDVAVPVITRELESFKPEKL